MCVCERMCMSVYVYVHVHMCYICMWVSEQFVRVDSLLLLCNFQESNPGHRAWWQVLYLQATLPAFYYVLWDRSQGLLLNLETTDPLD